MRDSNPLRLFFPIVVIPPFSQCFQRFLHGLQFTVNHCKSLQLPEECGQNVGTDAHMSPDHRQSEALARPPFHGQILLVVAKQQQEAGVLAERSGFQLLDHSALL